MHVSARIIVEKPLKARGRRRWPAILSGALGVLVLAALILFRIMFIHSGSPLPVEPFRIAGNLYYVGASNVTAFLLTGPDGDVLIDGGYPRTAPMIMASIAKLGFKITDVKVLLNSHAHFDHAGGLAELQKASGPQLWVSDGDSELQRRIRTTRYVQPDH